MLSGISNSSDISPEQGENTSTDSTHNAYFFKIDSTGNVMWEAMYLEVDNAENIDVIRYGIEMNDGRYALIINDSFTELDTIPVKLGERVSNGFFILVLQEDGDHPSLYRYGYSDAHFFSSKLVETSDDHLVVSGLANTDIIQPTSGLPNQGGADVYIIKFKY